MKTPIEEQVEKKVQEIEEILKEAMPEESGYARTVLEAMNYSLMAGGKRLRPLFIYETCRMYGGREELAAPFMAGIEEKLENGEDFDLLVLGMGTGTYGSQCARFFDKVEHFGSGI